MTPPRRIADLHCHYPMHVIADRSHPAVDDRRRCSRKRWWWLDGTRIAVFTFLARMVDFDKKVGASWRVDFDGLKRANTGLVLSVLYDPGFEWLVIPFLQRPRRRSFDTIVCQLECVEKELAHIPNGGALYRLVKTRAQLDEATAKGLVAFVHCIEGGFHLGREKAIAENVETLARCGVVYVTLAHLFYRGVASNAPAIPFLPDPVYRWLFPQRRPGLSALGRAAVTAMYQHKMLIDVTHMDARALADTFALLNQLDAGHGADPKMHPVIASHAGYRFGQQEYMLEEATILEIARRGGLVGLILTHHQTDDGLPADVVADKKFEAVKRHIDEIHRITGSHQFTCIGSDLDGFVTPIEGIDGSADLADLASKLYGHYGADADAILFDNAARIVWQALPA